MRRKRTLGRGLVAASSRSDTSAACCYMSARWPLYVGTLAASEIVFAVGVSAHRWAATTPEFLDTVLYVVAGLTFAGLFANVVRLVRALQAMGREAAPVSSISPAD